MIRFLNVSVLGHLTISYFVPFARFLADYMQKEEEKISGVLHSVLRRKKDKKIEGLESS